ncbi:UBC-like protein [Xylaria cf. heliscus]|nr:UBC-like protein [Xylaria cf. heliscus]
MTATAIGRMMAERAGLEEENTDYKVFFKDDNLLDFEAFVYGPDDSLYRHKLVKLRFVIPPEYPILPPQVHFIQYSGGRIHPNLYVDGKVCLSILGTWPGEPWSPGLSIHVVLVSIRSILDNEPYRHEPGCNNDPTYNKFVQYTTWRTLLLDHIQREGSEPIKSFLRDFVRTRSTGIMGDIYHEQHTNREVSTMTNLYSEWTFPPDYDRLIQELKTAVEKSLD